MSAIPYEISINQKKATIKFAREVNAITFFANMEQIQLFFEKQDIDYDEILIDMTNTDWFDTLGLCYLLMFVYDFKQKHSNTKIVFALSEKDEDDIMFIMFLKDNGFHKCMLELGQIIGNNYDIKVNYSNVHKCFWPFTILHSHEEISLNIDYIKKFIKNEFKNDLTSSELEYTTSKVTYFLKETLDNAFRHGYSENLYAPVCSFLIKRVKSNNAEDLKKYRKQYIENTPYIDVSLYEDNDEYLEIYVADIGMGIRHSFLNDFENNKQITDENIIDYIITEGKRSQKRIASSLTTRYGGLYDIVSMFKNDGDKLGIKADSRWCFTRTNRPLYRRINANNLQHCYGKEHGFAIVGSINWKRNDLHHNEANSDIEKALKNCDVFDNVKNPWMIRDYCKNLCVIDFRFTDDCFNITKSKATIIFPNIYLYKNNIADFIMKCNSDILIIAGIHESEYKKYKTTIQNINTNNLITKLTTIILISNSLFANVFELKTDEKSFIYSLQKTLEYIECPEIINDRPIPIYLSFKSFILWKKVYDSEIIWEMYSKENPLGYINSKVKWGNSELRGYLDFSQFSLVPECHKLCIEQLFKFKYYSDSIYFCSLDRFTDEICEKANHLMNNSIDGERIWIGSVFVSGTSERNLIKKAKNNEKTFYFFRHIDHVDKINIINTIFEWATKEFRLKEWFNPEYFKDKEYSRVGNTSFIAEEGSLYWASKHYTNYDNLYCLKPYQIYSILQTELGARPAVLKLGHFNCGDHHDLFEIKTDVLFDADMISSKLVNQFTYSSYDYLIAQFLHKLIPYRSKNKIFECLNSNLSMTEKNIIFSKYVTGDKFKTIKTNESGIIVYLNDYETSSVIETIKPLFSNEIRKRIIPIVPFENNFVSSMLFISPLLLERVQSTINKIRNSNKKVSITLFISTYFTTRLEEELRHIFLQMGADNVYSLSILDRRRLPYGNNISSNIESYFRLDLPSVGLLDFCPVCISCNLLSKLKDKIRDQILLERIDDIIGIWRSIKLSDNYCNNGIEMNIIKDMPDEVTEKIKNIQNIYGQSNININTDLGLALFAIESTGISLSTDFLDICIKSEYIDDNIKILMISSHLLIFDCFQLSERHFCSLLIKLCDLLNNQSEISPYTSLAVITLSAQSNYYNLMNSRLINISKNKSYKTNYDCLILKLILYTNQSNLKHIDKGYIADLRCHLTGNNNAIESIYDMLLYVETDYVQSHRQAFSQIKGTSIMMNEYVYEKAVQYIQKLEKIYNDDSLEFMFYDSKIYIDNKPVIIKQLYDISLKLKNIKSNADHIALSKELNSLLRLIQDVNKGNLYLRASANTDDKDIISWLEMCKNNAMDRTKFANGNFLIKTNVYNCGK